MKRLFILTSSCILLLLNTVSAQKVNTDSLTLVAKISEDQLKLGKLQNTVDQKIKNKSDAADNAQKSADNNAAAAEKLSTDPTDKKLGKKADAKASDAKSDARKARKESDRLDQLNKDIINLKQKIAAEQANLNAYAPTAVAIQPDLPVSALPDSTQHQ